MSAKWKLEPWKKSLMTTIGILLFLAIAISDTYSNGYKHGQIDVENGIHRDTEGEME